MAMIARQAKHPELSVVLSADIEVRICIAVRWDTAASAADLLSRRHARAEDVLVALMAFEIVSERRSCWRRLAVAHYDARQADITTKPARGKCTQTSPTAGSLRRMTISWTPEATNSPTTGSRPVSSGVTVTV
ncbi:hypothetical protein [Bradyrhizobium sp. CCGUVB23]|uniref:hypothetical protein n=1 Tax=Bradyrhizobium sp. CCGUVB23 TaxID=2949630 RepID=UPI0020B1D877|nr:hypothetical protein [Bradyrhizobium sp. CCGUVB23]MCP3464663.1 hypothetical protein [Bradyrhizobium sp. CCGUVB23]